MYDVACNLEKHLKVIITMAVLFLYVEHLIHYRQITDWIYLTILSLQFLYFMHMDTNQLAR